MYLFVNDNIKSYVILFLFCSIVLITNLSLEKCILLNVLDHFKLFIYVSDLLDKFLETRIRLQKSMQSVNTLPQNETMKSFVREGGPQIQQSYKDG